MLVIQVRMWQTNALGWKGIAVLAIFVRFMALPIPPVLSDDTFRYLWDGLVNLEGMNPFVLAPSDPRLAFLHDSDLFPLINRPDVHTVYPPVSQAIFTAAAAVGGDAWMRGFVALKALSVVVELTGLYLLSRIMERRSFMLLALSPVLLVAGAIQGHTDILLVGFLGGALWSWRRNHVRGTVLLLTLAGWVKLWPLLFVVTFLLYIFRQDKRLALQAALISGATSVLLWMPFLHPSVPGHLLESLNLYVRWFEFNAGPYYVVKEWYWWTTGMDWSKQIGPAFRLVFLSAVVLIWVLQMGAPRRLRFVVNAERDQPWLLCWSIACLYFLLSTTIHPWYIVGLVLLGIVLFESRIPWHVLLFSVLSFGTYLLYVDGPYWWAVALAWSSAFALWVMLQVTGRRTGWMDMVMRWRAWSKMQLMRPWVSASRTIGAGGGGEGRLLDLGGAEGYVASAVLEAHPGWMNATIVDIRKAGRTNHKYLQYDGEVLPMNDDSYDTVLLSYVLHHARHPELVLSESLRVSFGRVVILESVYRSEWGRRWLFWADRLANGIRSRGDMNSQHDDLHHQREEEWLEMARCLDARILGRRTIVRPGHTTAVIVLEPVSRHPNG